MDVTRNNALSAADEEEKAAFSTDAQTALEEEEGAMLSAVISDLLAEKNNQQIDKMLGQLAAALQADSPQLRLKAACELTDTLELLIAHQEWLRIDKMLPAAESALHAALENEVEVWQLVTALSAFAAYQIEMGKYASARRALLTFSSEKILAAAPEHVRDRIGRLLNDMATRPLLELLLVEYLYDKDKSVDAGRLFAVLGRSAAEFLLEPQCLKLYQENKADVLLKLFSEIGPPAEESLCRLLEQTQDWYLIRNIIRLLGDKGGPACFTAVTSFIEHEDIRVKGEVLRAASRIDAPGKKDFFLRALKTVPRQLTELVVALIGDIPDSSLVAPLAILLDEAVLIKNRAGQNLQLAICLTLGKIGSVKAVPTLKKIIAASTGKELGQVEQQILRTAEQAIQFINTGGKHKRVGSISPDVPSQNNPFAAREAGIIRMAMSGNRSGAAQQLLKLIMECVQNEDIFNAERLRERFSEINPNAIAEIIRASELIEEAKSGVQVRSYLDIWSNLLHELSSEEFSAIYHELEHRTLEPEEMLVKQGDQNDELFFVNHGTVRVFYKKHDRKIYIKSLCDGDLAGENFFDTSVWTVSMNAVTESRISVLKRACFERWKEAYPGLEKKLKTFYNKSNNIRDLLQRKGLNRRAFDRYEVSRKVDFQVLEVPGKRPLGQKFKGRLADVSRGGLSMTFRMMQQKHIRVLLGRTMQITIPVVGSPNGLDVRGQVLSIKQADPAPTKTAALEAAGEYKLSLEFDEPLEHEQLQLVLG